MAPSVGRVVCVASSVLSLCAVGKMALSVDRVVCGSLMTSLEMAGVSLTLLKMQPGWNQCIGMCISSNNAQRTVH